MENSNKKGGAFTLNSAILFVLGSFLGLCIGVMGLFGVLSIFNNPILEVADLNVCYYDGKEYTFGESFVSSDACNICLCGSEGKVTCTRNDCGANDPSLDDNVIQRRGQEIQSDYLETIVTDLSFNQDWETNSISSSSEAGTGLYCADGDILNETSDGREIDPESNIYVLNVEDLPSETFNYLESRIVSYLNDTSWELCRLIPNSAGGTGIYYKDGMFIYLSTQSPTINTDISSITVGIEY